MRGSVGSSPRPLVKRLDATREHSDAARPELVEGLVTSEQGFDKLSPNGNEICTV